MLRLAPNLQVAQITAQSYAITARGFNGSTSDKLLVLVDGRSVYTPFANGVFWDLQQVLPDDIERIEVISGPGATLWGANAVNGVINIITRHSDQTQDGLIDLGGGNLERRGSLRYGGSLGEHVTYRAYGSDFYYADSTTTTGANAHDHWHKPQGGFRLDWSPGRDAVILEGDAYRGSEASPVTANQEIAGRNLIARWSHPFDGGSTLEVHAYYDHIGISVPRTLSEDLSTYDWELQHTFSWGSRQQIVWGGGYRITQDSFAVAPGPVVRQFFDPQRRTLNLDNFFVQDSIALMPSFKMILGTKVEDDPYSGTQVLPSVRFSWKVTDKDLLWSAVSRAIRAPSRLDRDFFQTEGPFTLLKGDNFQPERLIAYEMGYRAQPAVGASLSISAYYNQYQDLRNAQVTVGGFPPIPSSGVPSGGAPLMFGNGMEGDTYGIELWGNYQVAEWWRLGPGFDWLHKNLRFKPGASRIGGTAIAGDDPTWQFLLRSSMNLNSKVKLDLDLRSVASLPAPASPSYTELNAHLGWALSERLQISARGYNLLHSQHLELGNGVPVERSYYIDVRCSL
jgi:iron complex outermembrane receptor protein